MPKAGFGTRPIMISAVDPASGGAGPDWVGQVEEIFSPKGLLSRARNFEYRPQQQAMAVAVAEALERYAYRLAAPTLVTSNCASAAPSRP